MRFVQFKMALFLYATSIVANAPDPEACREVRFADIGWTDVSATTAVAAEIFSALGYNTSVSVLSLPVTFAGLENGDVDVFLGNWMPAQRADIEPYLARNGIEILSQNLQGAKYTLAVPQYVYDAGLKDFRNIAQFRKELNGKIYGIEPGNDGNGILLDLIEENTYGLKNFDLVESSEQGMLVSVKKAYANNEWVVFLGWAPHPMNAHMKLAYLNGGDDHFGANFGASTVHTIVRKNYEANCPNAARLLKQIEFTVESENTLMAGILTEKLSPQDSAQKWLRNNQTAWKPWVSSINSITGRPANVALKLYLKELEPSDNLLHYRLPLGAWVAYFFNTQIKYFADFLHNVSEILEGGIDALTGALSRIPFYILILAIAALVYLLHRNILLSTATTLGLLLIVNFELWQESIETLVLVLLATSISASIGIPLGVVAAKKPLFYKLLRPILDLMQTVPTFVYLIPTLMLFGLGVVPGLVSTIIFSMPAPIRLTNLALQNFPVPLREAALGLGATKLRTLFNVELPYIKSSIVAGISQCVMLSLSMVVIAAMVGADGLGVSVVRALNTVNIQLGFEAGLAIVILAIILDRTVSRES